MEEVYSIQIKEMEYYKEFAEASREDVIEWNGVECLALAKIKELKKQR